MSTPQFRLLAWPVRAVVLLALRLPRTLALALVFLLLLVPLLAIWLLFEVIYLLEALGSSARASLLSGIRRHG